MKGRAVLAAAVAALAIAPAGALAADPPEGAAMSDNLEYVARVAGARGITEGKFDRVRGDDVLVVTGRFGFKTYDVSDPEDPQELDTFLPPDIAEFKYWQDEDMELDTRRKLIIGALDPRHTDAPLGSCPPPPPTNPTGTGGSVRDPDCKSGFYVISYADPANLRQIGEFVSLPAGHTASCIQKCRYIWTGGPARRDDQDWLRRDSPVHRPARWRAARGRRPPDLGDRPARPGEPRGGRGADRPVAQRRLHRLLT